MALLKKAPPSREAVAQAARAELAAAITQYAEGTTAYHAAAAALEDAKRKTWQARSTVEDAAENIKTAHSNAALYERAQLLGRDDVEAPQTVREARDALQDAEDAAQAAEAVLQSLEKEARLPSEFYRDQAVIDVLQSEPGVTQAVADEVIRLQQELLRYSDALDVLVKAQAFPTNGNTYNTPLDSRIATAHGRCNLAPSMWHDVGQRSDIAGAWRGAIEALKTDSTVPLPASKSA